jgi:hypothetical protein
MGFSVESPTGVSDPPRMKRISEVCFFSATCKILRLVLVLKGHGFSRAVSKVKSTNIRQPSLDGAQVDEFKMFIIKRLSF